jgi:hypothetical protein
MSQNQTRYLKRLITTLRQAGVIKYQDATITLELAPPAPPKERESAAVKEIRKAVSSANSGDMRFWASAGGD